MKKTSRVRLRIVILIVLAIQLSVGAFYHLNEEASVLAQLAFINNPSAHTVPQVVIAYGHLLASFSLIIILFFGYFYETRQRIRLQNSFEKAELTALKARVQPHFLFNTLNTIVYQIRENPGKASDMVRGLADLYRYILQSSNVEFIPLEHELDFIRKYLAIEKVRFGERLRFEIDVPVEWLKREIPTLILQPIVENAVQYGLKDTIEGGVIKIAAAPNSTKETLTVEDNGTGMTEYTLINIHQSSGHGLRNVNERWSLVTGNSIRIESTRKKGTRVMLDW
ncbi:MAG: hypothetical protein GY866_35055 [Proteobacteria bacterium]|nr:hypothetical protein [Pseudomonadota bacterium]